MHTDAEEIGTTMRPAKPLTAITVASYLLRGIESITSHEGEAILEAIGKDRLTELVKADTWRWKHNGYGQNKSNERRLKEFMQMVRNAKRLRKDFEKGKIGKEEFDLVLGEMEGNGQFFKRNQDLSK